MADYNAQTVVRPNLVVESMSPLTYYLLTEIFDHDFTEEGIYLYSPTNINYQLSIKGEKLCQLSKESEAMENGIERLYEIPIGTLNGESDEDDIFEITIDDDFIDKLFQDVIRRSSTLTRIEVITAFTCSKMRPDGFGGSARVITANHVSSVSTFEFLQS